MIRNTQSKEINRQKSQIDRISVFIKKKFKQVEKKTHTTDTKQCFFIVAALIPNGQILFTKHAT